MKNISVRLFEVALFIFAFSVVMTMFLFTSGDEENTIGGFTYGFYLLPLYAVNLIIAIVYIKRLNFTGINASVVLWLIIAFFNVLFISSNKAVDIIRVSIWPTSFFSAYLLAINNKRTLDILTKLFFIIFVFSLYFFWQGKLFQSAFGGGMEAATNAIYCLVTVVPFLMFLKKKWLRLVLLLIVFVSTVFSSKRGATIIMMIALIPTMNSVFTGMKNKRLKRTLIVVIGVIIVFVLYAVANTYVSGRLLDRFNSIEETGGSGRQLIWENTMENFRTSSFSGQLFGHGPRGVQQLGMATAAHNDFLEVLYDYGILGLIVYLSIHVHLIRRTIRLKKTNNPLFWSFFTMYIIFFVMSMVSILIPQQRYLIYMAVYWGCLEGYNYNVKLDNNN